MTRLKSIPLAIGGLVVLAGTAAAFAALPQASTHGINTATDHSGKSVPVRAVPADAPAVQAPAVDAPAADPADGPPPGTHGLDVSTAAKGDDTTPDTNYGADVSPSPATTPARPSRRPIGLPVRANRTASASPTVWASLPIPASRPTRSIPSRPATTSRERAFHSTSVRWLTRRTEVESMMGRVTSRAAPRRPHSRRRDSAGRPLARSRRRRSH